jgi:hypothetical protein
MPFTWNLTLTLDGGRHAAHWPGAFATGIFFARPSGMGDPNSFMLSSFFEAGACPAT